MTVVVHSTSTGATGAIKYARDGIDPKTGEKKCVAMSGFQTDPSNAEYQFSAVRKAYGKEKGVQAQIFIQSFAEDLEPEIANEIGLKTAERYNNRIGGGFQAGIYTHGNTGTIHNHFVWNSVNVETGEKYHIQRDLMLFREVSDEVSLEYGIQPPQQADIKKSFAEKKLEEQGKYVWKNDLRQRIDTVKEKATSFDDFKERLGAENVDVIERGTRWSFTFTDEENKQRRVRNHKLGAIYSPERLRETFEINQLMMTLEQADELVAFDFEHEFEQMEVKKVSQKKESLLEKMDRLEKEQAQAREIPVENTPEVFWYSVDWNDEDTRYNLLNGQYSIIAWGEEPIDNIALSSEIDSADLEYMRVHRIAAERPLTEYEIENLEAELEWAESENSIDLHRQSYRDNDFER